MSHRRCRQADGHCRYPWPLEPALTLSFTHQTAGRARAGKHTSSFNLLSISRALFHNIIYLVLVVWRDRVSWPCQHQPQPHFEYGRNERGQSVPPLSFNNSVTFPHYHHLGRDSTFMRNYSMSWGAIQFSRGNVQFPQTGVGLNFLKPGLGFNFCTNFAKFNLAPVFFGK